VTSQDKDSAASDDDVKASWEREARQLLDDLVRIHFHRALWSSTVEAIDQRAPRTDRTWQMHYTRIYIDSQAMAIRRILRSRGGDPHSSLNNLLLQLESAPHLTGSTSAAEIQRDRSDLNKLVDDVVTWADQTLAHIHRQPSAPMPAMEQLDSAINKFAEMFIHYAGRVGQVPTSGVRGRESQQPSHQPGLID